MNSIKINTTIKYLVYLTLLVGCASALVTREILARYPILVVAQPSGRLGIQARTPTSSTAIDLSPTNEILPQYDSLSELTLYRTNGPYGPNIPMERFNISAMASHSPDDPAPYRFGVEAENGGVFRAIVFCFENGVRGGPDNCKLKIDVDGVWVNHGVPGNQDWWRL